MECLVTGASGYLGRTLVPALAAEGHTVIAQYRSGEPPACAQSTVKLEFPEGISRLQLSRVDLVYHLAGIAHQQADERSYVRVNVQASVQLAERAIEVGAKRFIYLSSVKAASPPPSGTGYAGSKAVAETQLRALFTDTDTDTELVIVRPSLIYSAQAPGHLAWLRRWAALRMPAPPAEGSRSMIARQDLVKLLCLLASPTVKTPSLIVATDGERYSARRLHCAYASKLGREPFLHALPSPLWRGAGSMLDRLRREPVGSTWERLAGEEWYQSEGLEDIGFQTSSTFESCLDEDSACC